MTRSDEPGHSVAEQPPRRRVVVSGKAETESAVIPQWLHGLSIVYLLFGGACALLIAVDETRHPQHMWIMNVVWPVTALFGTAWVTWQYFTYGRLAPHARMHAAMQHDEPMPNQKETPFPIAIGNAALHCGSGCTLGDIVAEWLAFAFPGIAVAFGWHRLFDARMLAVWVFDYIVAFGFGVLFHYYTIKPMRDLSVGQGLLQAVKADALSLTAWQVGMYGFMAIAYFLIFRGALGANLETDTVEFWFMMQIAMLYGFATAYPVNWWLIRSGVKERM
jgi:hypothetical protein